MNLSEARQAVVTKLEAIKSEIEPSLIIHYENTPDVDLDSVGDYFLEVELDFNGSRQASLGDNPMTRNDGDLVLRFMNRAGNGRLELLNLIDEFRARLRYANLSGMQLQAVRSGGVSSRSGWSADTWLVGFWFYE